MEGIIGIGKEKQMKKSNIQFKCLACGTRCSKIRGALKTEEYEFLSEYAYGKMPLVQLVPMEKTTFPLWDWEAKRFMEWQKEAGIDAKIKPQRAIFDLDTGTTIIVTYYMDSDSCPFLSETGKCRIYDKKRAYICRLFPFQRTPFLEMEDDSAGEMFGVCPAIKNIAPNIPEEKRERVSFMQSSFGDNFLDAVENDLITAWANRTIIDLCKKYKVVRPAVNYPYESLLKRIENSRKIDFTDFLIEKKIYSKEKMDNLINEFDNNTHAKDKLGKTNE